MQKQNKLKQRLIAEFEEIELDHEGWGGETVKYFITHTIEETIKEIESRLPEERRPYEYETQHEGVVASDKPVVKGYNQYREEVIKVLEEMKDE